MLPSAIKTQIQLFGIGKALARLDIDEFLGELEKSEKLLDAVQFKSALSSESRAIMGNLKKFATAAKATAEAFGAFQTLTNRGASE